ncbi:hypothetical protein BUALT_Bualt15G0067900 [Buddleja alternifolia]|uniref:Glycosyltransferase n=1 Tax=Buddleja alternifolia TaxID=168488 RepID=A0AAV6WDG6_9LAMI|nr:hypothetical protein BUALT_Bualt15G0067900 [Buddleja alternifolia]
MKFITPTTMKPHAVLIPYPAQGHINPLLKLAKLLHFHGFFITFVNTEFNHNRLIRSRGRESVNGLDDFQFKAIPDGLPPSEKDSTQDIPQLCESLTKNGLAPFLDLVKSLNDDSSGCPKVSCLVSDWHMSFTLDASEQLDIPEVCFFTASACGLMGYCHFAELVTRGFCPLNDESQLTNGFLDTKIDWVPGMKNIRLRDFPSFIRTTDPNDVMVDYNILQTKNTPRAKAVIINTFDELETQVLEALRQKFDHVYSIGPLHLLERVVENARVKAIASSLWKEDDACIAWLNHRARASVLYVNFGSITILSKEQLLEFAWGLANSNHYFLWVIRPDLVSGELAILPLEFFKEVEGRAMMVGWCSQEHVLAHSSVGGFLTHCGWNSTIESISEGVPMICWPFFSEQQTNCRYLCTYWEIGLEIEGEVKREKVAELVNDLMDGEKGKEMKKKALEWKDKAQLAAKLGSSSHYNLEFLIDEILLRK